MPYQSRPNDAVLKFLRDNSFSLFSSRTAFAAGGVATAPTTLESHDIPDAAKTFIGWRPDEVIDDAAAGEGVGSVFSISGENYKSQPQEVPGPVATSILTTGGYMDSQSEYFDVFAKVSGGEAIDVIIEPLDAVAGNRRAAVELWWSEARVPFPVIFSQSTRETAVSAAGQTPATLTLNINLAHFLLEVGGQIVTQVMTVEEEVFIALVINASVLRPLNQFPVVFDPIPPIADLAIDHGPTSTYVSRRSVWERFLSEKATVTGTYTLDQLLTSAAAVAHYIRWI